MQAVNLALARTSTVGFLLALTCGVFTGASAAEPPADGIYLPTATVQSETDEYTRYELLAPGSGKFRITYEVTATTAGATTFYNPIRKGSAASDEAVLDAMTGQPLRLRGRQRRRRTQGSADARRRCRHRLHQGDARSPRADEWPGPPRHPQDVRGPEELLRRRQDDRIRPIARHTPQQDRAARGLRSRRPDGAFPDHHRSGRSNRHQLRQRHRGRGAARAPRGEGCADRRGRGAEGGDAAAKLGIAVRRRDRGGSPRRTRAPGPRHRLLPAAARVARVPALPRLHRVATGHQRLRQRRPHRQHGEWSVGAYPRYRRSCSRRRR